jgi:heparan-alpha-glucosaminide N-acetyltransferase
VASICYLSLSILYVLVDLLNLYSGTPFLYLGRNSITIYISHIVFANYFPFFAVSSTHTLLLAKHLYGVALWCVVAAIMNHYKVFINL